MATTEYLPTSALKVGDIVRNYGMRIELVEGGEYPSWPGTFGFHGRILNVEQVDEAGLVPRGWRRSDRDDIADGAYWKIQGNDLATWAVER